MELRPHHILCIQKFTGHGYDPAFTAHMTAVVSALSQRPDAEITLREGCDTLCRMCPNRVDGRCTSLEKVDTMDRAVLSCLGLAPGARASWGKLAGAAWERIFNTPQFPKICAECEWFSLCSDKESR